MFKKKIAQAIEPAAEVSRSEKSAEAVKPKKKKLTFKDAIARVSKWFRELKSEYKKVVWPTRQQIMKNTAVVLVILLFLGVFIGLLDFAFEKLILEQLLKVATGY